MNPYDEMLALLRRCHTEANGERLANEMFIIGNNVVRDFLRLKVGLPWVWSDAMGAFYNETDAFVYEGLAFHYSPIRIHARAATAAKIKELLPNGGTVLCYGDGIGFDSCEIAVANPKVHVVSFEPGRASSSFARKLIDDLELASQIQQLSKVEELKPRGFDVLICYDVLEHVPCPMDLIQSFTNYLKPDGNALIAEAFAHVEPTHPTHLLSNLKYACKTISLFRKSGFSFQGMMQPKIQTFKLGTATEPSLRWNLVRQAAAGVRARLRFKYRYGSPEGADLNWVISIKSPVFLTDKAYRCEAAA